MARTTYRKCKYCGDWHDIAAWPANHIDPAPQRSSLPSPMLIRDEMDPVQSMADGKIYTSKHAIRQTYKPSGNPQGNSYLEVGDDKARFAPPPKPKPDVVGVKTAIEKAKARFDRGERVPLRQETP